MIRAKKVLLPTDFSQSANAALAHAVYLAHQFGAELHMLHVIVLHEEDPYNPAHHFPQKEDIARRLRELADDQMRKALEDIDVGELEIRQVRKREVSAAPAIVQYVKDEGIDLVVMGTHGRRGVRHFLVGSVTEEVVRTAPCAVFSVRSERDPLGAVNRVLAPVDFSDASLNVVQVACESAVQYGADLHVMNVLENVLHPAFYNMGATSIRDLQPDIDERTKRAMRKLIDEAGGTNLTVDYVVEEGHAARTIVEYARESGTGLIVISTHGMTGLEHFLIGSVAEKVVRRAPCPVLVVKPNGTLRA